MKARRQTLGGTEMTGSLRTKEDKEKKVEREGPTRNLGCQTRQTAYHRWQKGMRSEKKATPSDREGTTNGKRKGISHG